MKTINELLDMKQANSADFMVGYLLAEYEHVLTKLAAKEEIIKSLQSKRELPKPVVQQAPLNPIPKAKVEIKKKVEKRGGNQKRAPTEEVIYNQLKLMMLTHGKLSKPEILSFLEEKKIILAESTFNARLYKLIKAGKILSTGNQGNKRTTYYSLPASAGSKRMVVGTNYGAMNLNA